jgi:transposase InsO family protein
VADALSGRAHP